MSFTAAGPLDYEVQELVGGAVIEPVDNLLWHHFAKFRVIGQDLDLHFLVYNLAIGSRLPSARITFVFQEMQPNITPIFSRN